jgi:hypothetical protein
VAAELLGEGVRPEREQPRRKGRPQIALLPEGAELVRPQPTLEDIATETTVHTGVVLDMHNAV